MKIKFTSRALYVAVAVFLSLLLCAWNKPGHQATGAIAFLYLNENSPSTVSKVVDVLKAHPEFDTRWSGEFNQLQGEDQSMYLFMKAAEWPDIIKDNNPNGYPVENDGHYINWPIKFKPLVKTVSPGDGLDILKQIDLKLKVVKTTQDEGERAMALCWIFHLMGDLHQPLHNVALFDVGFPKKGDQGGNLFYVRETEDGSTRKLHAVWDGALTSSSKFTVLKQTATGIKDSEQIQFTAGSTMEFEAWSKDFVKIAEKDVYKFNNKIVLSGTSDDGKVLPTGYMKNAKKISKKQAATAGMRLAALLSETF